MRLFRLKNINKFIKNIILNLATVFMLSGCMSPGKHIKSVGIWQKWSYTLISTVQYDNPYADVVIKVKYTGPGNHTVNGYAFWDGDSIFRLNCFFPHTGLWEWVTCCSDSTNSSLHNITGKVQVVKNNDENKLFKHGYLKVSDNNRYLTYNDGTPFLWIGETAWAAVMNATYEEWQEYINARKQQGFTVIQIFSIRDWAGETDAYGNTPFFNNDLHRANPIFWQEYERKVQYVNQQDMLVLVVGLMEPLRRYPSIKQVTPFVRNQVARLMGNHVIFSPSFDSGWRMETLADTIGKVISDVSSLHLITQHTDTDIEVAEKFFYKPYLDFSGMQSGAGWYMKEELVDGKKKHIFTIDPDTAAMKLLNWGKILYGKQPNKPVVNLEARYDNDINQEQLPRLPRSCGYWSFLSGCCGYSYGCAGIWNWSIHRFGNANDVQASNWHWRKALYMPSANDMTNMASFFSNVKWWELKPYSEDIVQQSSRWIDKMVFAKSDDNSLGVAYLPANNCIELKYESTAGFNTYQWFNPSTGEYKSKHKIGQNRNKIFTKPIDWEDAILLLNRN